MLIKPSKNFQLAARVYHTLSNQGYKTLFAGGCVRDALLGLDPKDFDLATEAKPEEVEGLFDKTIAVGKAFGVVKVLMEDTAIEVVTFRTESAYVDGRRPSEVHFSDPKQDALRRDFSVNALMYDLNQDLILDYVNGQKDLKAGLVRAVGDPLARFQEDHLRILRAIRFAVKLDFELEEKTWLDLVNSAHLVAKVSRERITEELSKIFECKNSLRSCHLLLSSQVLRALFSDIAWDPRCLRPFQTAELWSRWAEFFVWAYFSDASFRQPQLERELSQLRLANEQNQAIKQALAWFFFTEQYFGKSAGELTAKAFSPAEQLGFIMVEPTLVGEQRILWLKVRQLLLEWGQAPLALVKAADLPVHIQGQKIGQALRMTYWAQLEKLVRTKQEGLDWLFQQSDFKEFNQ